MEDKTISGVGFSAFSSDGEVSSLAQELRIIADLGADFAEIAIPTLDVLAGGRIIDSRAQRLVAEAQTFPLRYTLHGMVCANFMDPELHDRQKQIASAHLELCNRLEAGVLVHHGGFLRPDQEQDRASANQREIDALGEMALVAERYGVRVVLENIFTNTPGEYRQTPAEVAQTVRIVDHPNMAVLIDFGHAYIECTYRNLDFREQLRAMAPVTGHLHVHDNFGQPSGGTKPFTRSEAFALGLGDLHMPLGWGDIAWDDIFSELDFLPDTVLMMEIENRRFAAEQPENLARARSLAALVNDRTKVA